MDFCCLGFGKRPRMDARAAKTMDTAADKHWSLLDDYLRRKLREEIYTRWFSPLRAATLEGDRLDVSAPDKFHCDFVEDNYGAWFHEFVGDVVGHPLRVQFVVDDRPRTRGP